MKTILGGGGDGGGAGWDVAGKGGDLVLVLVWCQCGGCDWGMRMRLCKMRFLEWCWVGDGVGYEGEWC